MPANVESMAFTAERGVPWHGEGRMIDSLATAGEMIEASGLDWEVALEPIALATGEQIDFKQAVVRQTDRSVLGVIGMGYKPVQNAEAFDFADALVADDGNKYETAGSLDGGKTIFLSVDLSAVEPIKVAGDSEFKTFLLLSNAHDGSKALRVTVTPVRVVCQNTLNLAFRGSKNVFTIRHTGDVQSKMTAARDALDISIDYMRRFESVAASLVDLTITDARAEKVVRDAFQMRESTEDTPDSKWHTEHHATKALDLLSSSADLAPFKGTGWGVLNAVAEYVDHERQYGKGTERDMFDVKMTSILWGNGADVLNRTAVLLDPKIAKQMSPLAVRKAQRVASRVKVNA